MTKIYVLIVLFLACGWGFTYWGKTTLENDFERLATNYEALMGNKMFLEKELDERNKEKILLSERNRELEEEAKNDKSGFDWNFDISKSSVIKRLQAD